VGVFQSGIIEVEAINVDVDEHSRLLNAETAITAVSHPAAEATGGVSIKILPKSWWDVKEKAYRLTVVLLLLLQWNICSTLVAIE
jgi:hypothetical protein